MNESHSSAVCMELFFHRVYSSLVLNTQVQSSASRSTSMFPAWIFKNSRCKCSKWLCGACLPKARSRHGSLQPHISAASPASGYVVFISFPAWVPLCQTYHCSVGQKLAGLLCLLSTRNHVEMLVNCC